MPVKLWNHPRVTFAWRGGSRLCAAEGGASREREVATQVYVVWRVVDNLGIFKAGVSW